MAAGMGKDNAIRLAFSVVLAYLLTIIILLITAFLMLKAGIGGTIVSVLLVAARVLPVFAGGFFMGKRAEHKRFLWGLAVGVIYLIILLAVSLLIKSEPRPELADYIKRGILILLSAALGGMLS